MDNSISTGVVAASLVALCALPAGAARDVAETRPLAPDGRVRVETIAGTLTVTAGERPEVSVAGTLADALRLVVAGTDRSVSVRVEWPEGLPRRGQIRDEDCRLEVKLPAGASLETESVSASVDVRGVSGEVDVQSVSGDVRVAGDPRKLQVEAVSGEIRLDVGTKQVRLEAVSGDVHAHTGGGEFAASVVSGNVVLEGDAFESVRLEAVSGLLGFTGSLDPNGELAVSNHSGDVEVALRGELSARIGVTTFSGSIRSDFGGEAERVNPYAPGEEYERTLGEGTGRIRIDAFSGTVRLRRL